MLVVNRTKSKRHSWLPYSERNELEDELFDKLKPRYRLRIQYPPQTNLRRSVIEPNIRLLFKITQQNNKHVQPEKNISRWS